MRERVVRERERGERERERERERVSTFRTILLLRAHVNANGRHNEFVRHDSILCERET